MDTPSDRPTTPLEPSEEEPQLRAPSRGGGAYRWMERGEVGGANGRGGRGRMSEMDLLNESALDSRHQLLHAEEK